MVNPIIVTRPGAGLPVEQLQLFAVLSVDLMDEASCYKVLLRLLVLRLLVHGESFNYTNVTIYIYPFEGYNSKVVGGRSTLYQQQEPCAAKNNYESYKLAVKISQNRKFQPIKKRKGCRPVAQK